MQKSIHNVIDDLRADPAGISSKFGIPLRTVYGWCNGSRTPPAYIINMMSRIIELERRIHNGIEDTKEADTSGTMGSDSSD